MIEEEITEPCRILECGSGVEAIDLSREHHPDVILMDVQISEMDGLSAISEIRGFLPDACISIISAHSNFSYAQKAIGLKVFEYLLKPVKPAALKDLVERMFHQVSQPRVTLDLPVNDGEGDRPGDHQYFIEESLHFIHEHFRERLSLETVASKVFVNPKYLSHVFKKEVGVTFTEYIIKLRVQHACKLLGTTNYHAYRISIECGFSDPSYFNRVFSAVMKMTPQAYRKQSQTDRGYK